MPFRTPRSVCLLTSAAAAAEAYWLFGLGVDPVAGGCALVSVLCLVFASSAWGKVTLTARERVCDAVHSGARFLAEPASRRRELSSALEAERLFLAPDRCGSSLLTDTALSLSDAHESARRDR